MARAIYIEANRNAYNPDQIEHRSLALGELIEHLTSLAEDFGWDAKVFVSNDNGYTYGSVSYDDIVEGGYDSRRSWRGYDEDEEW